MGQALRRTTTRSSNLQSSSPSSSSQVVLKNIERPPPLPPPPKPVPKVELKPKNEDPDQDGISRTNPDNVLEVKDPGYDAMLSQMVGRIRTKPGGKLEMGKAFVVEKYDRPMPKLRNTKTESNYNEEKLAPPGTLNVAQLRQILLLHQGMASDHDGSMDVNQIAESFRIDVTQVEKVLQFVSLPPEDSSSKQQGK